ncbi:LysR family transcriptional regulator [Rhodococcus rhodnii LMG 5362]|uniref:LysR family transcriptional regulator n=2 Tax=Rhodococcus rhodnii TaxID=38312 RepID=R7WSE1_9NOCA|nr:LysR family transcriptional regulator [Rhodococcus rhodnii LMG 5362]
MPDVELELVPVDVADAEALVRRGEVDAGLIRLRDRDGIAAIALYEEVSVVVVPKDHVATAADEVSLADLADDVLLRPADDVLDWPPEQRFSEHAPASAAVAVDWVASGLGCVIVPLSLARLHHRSDLTYRTVTDAPRSSVALAWLADRATDATEELVGIVRGRTANSSRGRGAPAEARTRTGESDARRKRSENPPRQRGRSGAKGTRSGSPRGRRRR